MTRFSHVCAVLLALALGACGDYGSSRDGQTPGSVNSANENRGDSSGNANLAGLSNAELRTKAIGSLVSQANLASWGPLVSTPIVPISGANLSNGKVLLWSAEDRFGFGTDLGRTYTVLFDPASNQLTESLISNTGHDMFCPGTSLLSDGRLLVNGGLSSGKTSLYDPTTNAWSTAAVMNIPRAYQGTTPLADGSVLTLGGSWAGGVGNKHGERWTAANGWQRLSGVPIDPMLSVDNSRAFGMDSHLWLIPSGNGRVLHAGPGIAMNWIDTRGNGAVSSAGSRGNDEFSISGNTVMYDAGKILKTGGSAAYDSANSNGNSFIIDTSSGDAVVRRIADMSYKRAFHNSVVLPNGQVVIMGGQTYAVGFSDSNSVLVPEIFDPETESFVTIAPMAAPRNYHSIALLLPDGRVMSAGGGLCGSGCAANHQDFQILTPPYLLNADGSAATRPVITAAPRSAAHGQRITVSTDTAVSKMALVRLSSTTHTVNNDQRRLALSFSNTSGTNYAVDIPSNAGWAVPGEYMLFVMDANGTPSVSRTIRIAPADNLWLTPPDTMLGAVGTAFQMQLQASNAASLAMTYSASGLPAGLGINASTGLISGTPTQTGKYLVEAKASTSNGAASWQIPFVVSAAGTTQYVKFEALSEVAGNPWASAAEIELLGDQGQLLPRVGWSVTADSVELVGEDGAAANVIDGNVNTHWHTQWQGASPGYPHSLVINMGSAQALGGLRYTPRVGGGNGTVASYRIYLSADGVNWGNPVASGDLRTLGANADVKTVYFNNLAAGKTASQSSVFETANASRAVDGNTDGVYANASVTQTLSEANAWWEADLGSAQQLHTVRVWNRNDCCADRLTDFYVLLSPTAMQGRSLTTLLGDSKVTAVRVTGTAGRPSTIGTNGVGRYLRVQLVGTNNLSLAEVQAFGRPAVNRIPTLVTPNPQSTAQGQATSLSLSASDPDGDALSFSASGLPVGLSLNAQTGVISGTPSTVGNSVVQVSVSDGRGGSANASFTWNVSAAATVVQAVAAPAIAANGTATYTANATGNGLQYSWDFGDGSAATNYSSNATVTHQYTQAGVYTVTLSVRDAAGNVTTRRFSQAVLGSSITGKAPASSSLAFETRSGANPRLWVVNADNDTVSLFDAVSLSKLGEIPVGLQPRSVAVAPSGRIWVANKGSANLSVIDPSSLSVVQTVALARGSQPYGVVIGGDGSVFVGLEGSGLVLKLNASGALLGQIALASPRNLALSLDGSRLLVSRFVSAPQPGEATAQVATNVGGVLAGGEVTELDPSTLALRRSFTLRHSDKLDTTISGRGVPNYLGAAAISPDGRSAWVPSKQDNIARGSLRDGRALDFQNTIRAVTSRLDLVGNAEDYAGRVDHDNSGLASAAVYHPNGAYLFVVLETSRQLVVMDAQGKRELFTFDVGRAPQGVTVSADGRRLFVSNFMDRSVSVFNLGPLLDNGESALPSLGTLFSVGTEKLAANVLKGKQLFYDARDTRLARDAYISCASCHNDGGHDGRTWDFTGFGEGLRNTTSLKGRAGLGHGFVHWTANFDEVQDFEAQIRNFAGGTGLMSDAQFNTGTRNQPLGDKKAGVSADLDALAAYVSSLGSFDPSPYRPATASLSNNAQAGKDLFQTLNCAGCHSGTVFTNSADASRLQNIGSIKASSGQRLGQTLTGLDVPTLRDVWQTAPYLHDGSAATLEQAIAAHNLFNLSAGDLTRLATYLREVGPDEPSAITPVVTSGTNCASEGGTCTIPAGSTATVYFGANGRFIKRTGVTGSLSCSTATFGDPAANTAKTCFYVFEGQASGTGLRGEYFNNMNLQGSPIGSRMEQVNFDWGTGAPISNVGVDNFSVRWSGWIEAPSSGNLILQTLTDDGVRLWFDNRLVIDDWNAYAPKATNATVSVVAGQRYRVMMEYYEQGGGAVARLNWQLPGSTTMVAVPLNRLYPAAAGLTSNIAQGKAAVQSSTYGGAGAGRALDGNLNGSYSAGSVTHTNSENQAWWQVDLGSSRNLERVQLWNRLDCCTDRLQNFVVLLSNSDMQGKTLTQLLADPNVQVRRVGNTRVVPNISVPFHSQGRYVRVQLQGQGIVSLAEVQAFGN